MTPDEYEALSAQFTQANLAYNAAVAAGTDASAQLATMTQLRAELDTAYVQVIDTMTSQEG